jgi:CCR4-NOT transcription complex subunit 4
MFLHEPGEDDDSFTRQDLSMMNSIQTQQPSISASSRAAPPAHPGPAVAAAPASTPMYRQDSNDTSSSSHDAPSLPATASWANKAVLERRASRSTIASNPSPLVTNAIPAQTSKPVKTEEPSKKKAKEKERKEAKEKEKSAQSSKSTTPLPARSPARRPAPPSDHGFSTMLKIICSPDFKFVFSSAAFTEEEFQAIKEFPQLLDPQGGAKRRAMKEREKELALQREAESDAKSVSQQTTSADREESEATAGGSLQLGGEPEEGHDTVTAHLGHHAMAPGGQQGFGGGLFGQNTPLAEEFSNLGLSNRGLTTQQQQQLLLSNFKSNTQPGGPLSNQQSIQSQQHGLNANGPGHTRQTSRFSFANDSASASANVQPVANQKLMSQQNSMMPKNSNQFGQMSQHQSLGGQFFTNVQGPPPGLKPTGTPPVGGTSMFGQGHGFATGGLGYGANAAGRNNSDAMYQDLLRSSNMNGGVRLADAGKRESMFPSFLAHTPTASTSPAPGLLPFPYGPSPGAYQDSGSQKSKKKGKKHRHANTSSSGGGGLADVQDPSILQARLHQGGMTGQGLYGQGHSGFSSLYANNNYGGAGRW